MPNPKSFDCMAILVLLGIGLASSLSLAQDTRGLKFNNLTVSPFVNLEYTYDSNVYYDKSSAAVQSEIDDTFLTVNPGVDLTYTGNDWGFAGNGWWAYDEYSQQDQLNTDRYGESLRFYTEAAKRWRLVLGQSYVSDSQNDSIIDGGKGLWRDREQTQLNAALSYELSEKTKLTLSGLYSDLSYKNDTKQYDPLYGWTEYTVGLEVARKLTEKSNLLLTGSYQLYSSSSDPVPATAGKKPTSDSTDSTGYTLMAGVGSRATERIKYRATTGVNMYEYDNGEQLAGWAYSLDGSWLINKKWAASIAGSSNFQPSETQSSETIQVYTLSAGVTYRPMRKLSCRLDVAARTEEGQNTDRTSRPTKEDQYSVRARADYELMRYMTIYGGAEFTDQKSTDNYSDFDRYRGSVGLNLRY